MKFTAHILSAVVSTLALALVPATADAQQVQLEIRNGQVTLDATNATPAAILAEWARLGDTRIVDGDRLTGAPLTLKLDGVPERQALDIILRSAAGYIAAARPAGTPGTSTFDRIVVMPVSVNAAAARTSSPVPMSAPAPPVSMVDPAVTMPEMAPDSDEVAMQADDGAMAEQPVSSTNFDYANPQRYFAARAAQQRAAAEAAAPVDGTAADVDAGDPGLPTGFSTGTLLSTPGTIPTPEPPRGQGAVPNQTQTNPYGLPADAAPGTSTAPPMEPDRLKYINPYAPTPTPPIQ